MARGAIFTVGHSNRTLAALLAMLGEARVARLVDVRRYPRSRYNPQFNDRALAPALRATGIEYRHAPELGGMRAAPATPSPASTPANPSPPSTPSTPSTLSINDGWKPGPFRNYADYALTPDFQAALAILEVEAAAGPVAIMCAEKDWRQCHRQIVTDYLLSRGHTVEHLVSPGTREAALLDKRVVPVDGGRLLYRRPPPSQHELF
ncbi:MAG TPA: DUF488 domain-containing protein [Alphaproteobacteria bacterium]|nr:DUF488 domain-containing protein [Alphaproteobacteria bacterium]